MSQDKRRGKAQLPMSRKQHMPKAQAARVAVPRLFREALEHHQAGRLNEAESLYHKILGLDPRHADSLHFLGLAAFQTGRLDLAEALIGKAIAADATAASYHSNLGAVLRKQERLDEAVAAYRRALALGPDLAEAYTNLGDLLLDQGQLDEAAACHRKALTLRPDLPEAHLNLGRALQRQGCIDEAVACCRRAVLLRANFPEGHFNLGSALADQGALEEAVGCFRRALRLRAGFPEAHFNLANGLRQLRKLDEAIAHYRALLALAPHFADGHFNLALTLLSRGDMAAGWEEFEWRWLTPQMILSRRDFTQPQWRGEAAEGRTLLIHPEQGFGDTLQFCRYAALAAAAGFRVVMEVQQPLVRLIRGLSGCDLVLGSGDELPPFDMHCPILSLPLALAGTVTSTPSALSYLSADASQVAAWRTRLAAMTAGPELLVGLVWAGNSFVGGSPALAAQDRRRSLDPRRLEALFELSGVHFVSLQKDGPKAPDDFRLTDAMHEMEDFADTAALIANLDLVISVDTAVAHLAAALGKPVWMLDRFDPCWRWIEGRRDSPWYPTLRIYRQAAPDDWDPVVAAVARDLRELVAVGSGQRAKGVLPVSLAV